MATPNVILVTIDCLRGDVVQGDHVPTPFLDTMAKDGCSFERHVATGAWTAPSFIGIMTGQQPRSYARDMAIHYYPETLAETFQDAGYETIAMLDANYWISQRQGFDRGFDQFRNYVDIDKFENEMTAQKNNQNELAERLPHSIVNRFPSVIDKTWHTIENSDLLFEIVRRADMATATSKRGVGASEINHRFLNLFDDADEPVFGWAHYMDVHHPYLPERQNFRDRLRYPNPLTNYANSVSVRNGIKLGRHVASYLESLYERKVEEIDNHVERLVTDVRAATDRDTICIVMGDHGEEFGEHGRFNHRNKPYNELVHVPLVVDGVESATVERNTSAIDLKAGIEALADGERDFAKNFQTNKPTVRYLLHSDDVRDRTMAALNGNSGPSQVRTVVSDNYKIHFDSEREVISVYDLSTDYYEKEDINEPEIFGDLERHAIRKFIQEVQEQQDQTFFEEHYSNYID